MADDLGLSGLDEVVEIGRGAFGIVYKARQPEMGRLVAVKILTGGFDREALSRFDRERRALGSLSSHPHIVAVYASGVNEHDQPYLVMEFAPSGSLADRIARDGPLSSAVGADLAAKLGDALAFTHEHGVLHRDLKPENVVYSEVGEPMLADFGIARVAGATLTRTGVVTASVAHAAPEVLDGRRATPESDVYSLASTIYAAVAGHAPFVREDDDWLIPVIARVATEPPEDLRPHGVSPALCDLLERGLAKDPAARGTAAEFAAAARALTAGAGLPAAPPPSRPGARARSAGAPSGRSPSFRRPVVLGGGLAAVAVVVILIVVLAGGSGPTSPPTTTTSPGSTTTTTSATAQALPSGIYTNGPSGTPHYFINLTTKADGTLSGSVTFLAQDGNTSVAFTFTGTSQSGVASLQTNTGQTISAPFANQQLTLGQCTNLLQFATSQADCNFNLSPSGVQ